MSATLADRIRAAREEWVEAGGYRFNIRRPTALQLARFRESGDMAGALLGCVVGWNVPECDIVPGGGGAVPPFDQEPFREWIDDKPDLLGELSTKITGVITSFSQQREAAEKKS